MLDAALLHDEAFASDPFPVWTTLRQQHPVFHDTIDDVWIVSRHDDVVTGFSDTERFSNRLYRKTLGAVFGPTLLQMDGAPHIALRKIVGPLFVPTRLDRYRDLLADVVDELVASFDPAGFDIVRDLSAVLPGKIIVRMMGLPTEDDALFHRWYEEMMSGLWNDPELRRIGRAAHVQLHRHIDPIIERRRRAPGDDILSRLIEAGVDELPSFVSLLLTAGGETTDKALGNLWNNLLSSPAQLHAVVESPDLLDRAFDETMRHSPPLVYNAREVNDDVDWHGVTIPAGAQLRLAVGSANHDETVFAQPDEFDLHRTDLHRGLEHRSATYTDGAGHVGFGAGAHFCLGYALARLETTVASRVLLERFGAIESRGPVPAIRVRGPSRFASSLPVRAVGCGSG